MKLALGLRTGNALSRDSRSPPQRSDNTQGLADSAMLRDSDLVSASYAVSSRRHPPEDRLSVYLENYILDFYSVWFVRTGMVDCVGAVIIGFP